MKKNFVLFVGKLLFWSVATLGLKYIQESMKTMKKFEIYFGVKTQFLRFGTLRRDHREHASSSRADAIWKHKGIILIY